MKRIVFTGGGTAGHVMPNLALIAALRKKGWTVDYIGSADGIEQRIIARTDIPFHPIAAGKLRRYFDLNNLKDPFKVLKGVMQSIVLLKKLKPHAVFSKGGFVGVPVVAAARLLNVPVLIHESDMTPGLANKLSQPFARIVCLTFPETLAHVSKRKAVVTGLPIREELFAGNADRGRKWTGLYKGKPVLLVMGGSLGAKAINDALRSNLDAFLASFQIVHLCGQGHLDPNLQHKEGYRQYEFVSAELPDLLAMADLVVSRAGATAICELLALRKPMLLIPLSRQASRGDQIVNAQSFAAKGYCRWLAEEEMTPQTLYEQAVALYGERESLIANMASGAPPDSVETIVRLIEDAARP